MLPNSSFALSQRLTLAALIGFATPSSSQEQPLDQTEEPAAAAIAESALKRIPSGEVNVQFVAPVAPPRMMKGFATLTKAVQSKQAWWLAYQKEHASLPIATPYPYHANLGLSEADYDALAEFSKNSWVWTPVGEQPAFLDNKPDGKIELICQDRLETWNGLTFDPTTNVISLRRNTLTSEPESSRSIKLGPFAGFRVETWMWKDHQGPIKEYGELMVASIMSSEKAGHLYLNLQKMLVVGGSLAENKSTLFRIPAEHTPFIPAE